MTHMLQFTATEADLLGRTADALCAWMGKPVLAEIVTETAEGFEWALFALPLGPRDDDRELARVQAGGPGARFLGSSGGLNLGDGTPVDCQFLWAIQLSDLEGVRYIKVDASGEETGWSDVLADLLPFELSEAAPARPRRGEEDADDGEEDDGEEDDDDEDDEDEDDLDDDLDDDDLDDDDSEDEDEDEDDDSEDDDEEDDAEPDLGDDSGRH